MKNTRKNKKKSRKLSLKHYKSNDGMLTSVWGPSLWHYLHCMSFNYPNNPTKHEQKHYKDFIYNLQYVLPCKYCRDNLKKNLKYNPILPCHLKNRCMFSKYIYKLHETINTQLKKKSNLSYNQVRDRYENFRARCLQEKPNIFKFNKTKKHKGCVEPLYGKKSKCVIKILPQETKCPSLTIDKKCYINQKKQ